MIAARCRLSPIVLALLLAGCAGDGAGTAPSTATGAAVDVAPLQPAGFFDGTYQGTRTPEVGNPACGFVALIGFDVRGPEIRLRTHKLRRVIGGMIDRAGRFSMTSSDSTQQVVGEIRDHHLTATETTPPRRRRHDASEPAPNGLCTAQIVATRVADEPTP